MTQPPETRTFPIHPNDRHKLASVPWDLVAPHERQAQHNHSQSLQRLAERGGLSLCELLAVLTDRDYYELGPHERESADIRVMKLIVEAQR